MKMNKFLFRLIDEYRKELKRVYVDDIFPEDYTSMEELFVVNECVLYVLNSSKLTFKNKQFFCLLLVKYDLIRHLFSDTLDKVLDFLPKDFSIENKKLKIKDIMNLVYGSVKNAERVKKRIQTVLSEFFD